VARDNAVASRHRAEQIHFAADYDEREWAARGLRTLAGMFVLTWAFRLSGYVTFGPWLAVPVVALGLAGLLAIIAAWPS
jgi:hypothetical protein